MITARGVRWGSRVPFASCCDGTLRASFAGCHFQWISSSSATAASMRPPGLCLGHSDVPLSAEGFTATQRLAASWDGAAPRFLFASDLKRAQQSAQVFAARFAIEPLADARLRDVESRRMGRQALGRDRRIRRRALSALVRQLGDPGSARRRELRRRDPPHRCLVRRVARIDRRRTTAVLAVAHAGSIRALLCHALGLPPARALALVSITPTRAASAIAAASSRCATMNTPRFLADG